MELNHKKKLIFEYIRIIMLTFIVTQCILSIFQPSIVKGRSMMPTLKDGSIVLMRKYTFDRYHPHYQDIVVIDGRKIEGLHQGYIVKRVIGLEGDVIMCKNNVLYRNGERLEENYLYADMRQPDFEIEVGHDEVFVLGDHRNISLDSRQIGCINYKEIVGKVIWKLL